MKKINYIIIFILLIALGMVFKQLIDYKKMTEQLLQTNTQNEKQIKDCKEKVLLLADENKNLQDKIITKDEENSLLKLKHKNDYFSTDQNSTKKISLDLQPLQTEQPVQKPKNIPDITPNITLDEENEVTGFGFEYTQKF